MARSQYSKRSTFLKKGVTWLVIGFIPLLFADVGWTAGPSGGAPGKASGAVGRQYGGVLRVVDAAPGSPFGLPWETIGPSVCSTFPALESLVRMDRQGNMFPCLAETWKVAPDLKSITFNIKKGVKFHDGTDLNAEAVRFNLQAQMDAKTGDTMKWASVETVDDYTVRILLKAYDNRLFTPLAGTLGAIISPTWLHKNGIDAAKWHPVGTGPFEFVSYERDIAAKYKKFKDYWDEGKPYLDGVEIRYMRDFQTIKASLLANEIDVFGADGGELIAELVSRGFKDVSQNNGIVMLIPDSANPDSPLANKQVREALAYAIDREAVAKARGFGYWQPTNQFAFPEHSAYLKDYIGPTYDPAKAKQLLAKAGYPNGFKTKLIPQPFIVDRDAALAIQAFLAAVGIQADVEFPEITRYREYTTKGWRGLLIHPWGFFANYNVIIGFYFYGSQQFISMQRPPDLEKLFNESISTIGPDIKKVQVIHRSLTEHQTVISVYRHTRNYVFNKNVHDTGHMQWFAWPNWTPGEAWLSK